MGVTLRSKNNSIDLGYGGFFNLRKTIAGILSKEFQTLYIEWIKPSSSITDEEGNQRLAKLYEDGTLTDNDDMILDFLFAPDCDGKLPVKSCTRLYQLIKDYDDDILYGYWGRPDCAKFADFKKVVKDCIDSRCSLKWY